VAPKIVSRRRSPIARPSRVVSIEWLVNPSPGQLVEAARLLSDFYREFLPDEPDTPADELAAGSQCEENRRATVAVATDETGAVGTARVIFRDVKGRHDIAGVDHFVVRPDRRRQGVGTAMLAAIVEQARAEQRARLEHFVLKTHSAGMGFAAATGAHAGLVDDHNRLETARIDADLMKRWIAEGERNSPAYSLVPIDDLCPDQWLDRLARVSQVMNTAPRSQDQDEVIWTAGELRAHEKALVARGFWHWTLAVLHERSGDLVGLTELCGSRYQPWLAQQGDTGVEIPHRGRGLAKWMKATNALRLLAERPEATVIETSNAGVNAPMLAINHAMGFRRVAEWQEWTLPI